MSTTGVSKFRSPRAENVAATASTPLNGHTNSVSGQKTPMSQVRTVTTMDNDALKAYQQLCSQLCSTRTLFEDPDFVPSDKLLLTEKPLPEKVYWRRPHEICRTPHFFKDGVGRFDIKQGDLGNCWLLAALACLSQYPELVYKVVPPNQGFTAQDQYCGLFRFVFWSYGEWKQVLVDDRLPCYRSGKLAFMQSDTQDEFWSALLEKAYAKLVGSYEALAGGWMSEAMEDFTGGLVLTRVLQSDKVNPKEVFETLIRAQKRQSLMGCSIQASPSEMEQPLPNGLLKGHAYSITDVKLVDINQRGSVQLIRLRNPWGDSHEWNGPWSDKSREWNFISPEERERLGIVFSDDGEFWMPFVEFMKNFTHLEICYLSIQSADLSSSKVEWKMTLEHGEWRKNVNAGGCRNFLDTFWTNPQYRVTVTDTDDQDDANTGTLIVGLMQKNRRANSKNPTALNLVIGYLIYKLDSSLPPTERFDRRYFATHRQCAIGNFVNQREVCNVHRLDPGDYLVVPSTFEPNHEGEFLLRIVAEKAPTSQELDQETKEATDKVPAMMADMSALSSLSKEEDALLMENFKRVAGDDAEIDAYELRDVLDATFKREFKFNGFSLDCTRSMVALMDLDMSGKLGYKEFRDLWLRLRVLKVRSVGTVHCPVAVFRQYDANNNGSVNTFELREILKALGYQVSNKVLNSLVVRYGDESGDIYFNDFVACCVRMKNICEYYKAFMSQEEGKLRATFDQDSFLQCMMSV